MIDKGLYQTPEGLAALENEPAQEIEIEIENPDAVTISTGEMEIEIVPDNENDFGANLAENMDAGELDEIAGELSGLVEADINSRKDWVESFVKEIGRAHV